MRFAILFLLCVGCQQIQPAAPKGDPAPKPGPTEFAHTLAIEIPSNVVVALHQYLGDKNTVTLAQPLTIKQESLSVLMPAGASVSYSLSDVEGTVIFNKPKPRVTAKLAGITIHPDLDQIDLKAPASATAHVREFGREFKFDFPLAKQVAAVAAKPKLYFWHGGKVCIPCNNAETAFEAEKKKGTLPFEYILNPVGVVQNHPTELTPHFEWTGASGKTFWQTGFTDYSSFLKVWERSQKKEDKT